MSRQLTNTCCCGACLLGDFRDSLNSNSPDYQNLRILISNPISASTTVQYSDTVEGLPGSGPRWLSWNVTLNQNLDIVKKNSNSGSPPRDTYSPISSPNGGMHYKYWWWDQNLTGPGITGSMRQSKTWQSNTINFPQWFPEDNIPVKTSVCVVLRPVGGRIPTPMGATSYSWQYPDFYFMGYSVPNCENLTNTDKFSVDNIEDIANIAGYGVSDVGFTNIPKFCNFFSPYSHIDFATNTWTWNWPDYQWVPGLDKTGAGSKQGSSSEFSSNELIYNVAGPHHRSRHVAPSGPNVYLILEWTTENWLTRNQPVVATSGNAPEVNDTTLGFVIEIWVRNFIDRDAAIPPQYAVILPSIDEHQQNSFWNSPFVRDNPQSKYAQIHQQLDMGCEDYPFKADIYPPLYGSGPDYVPYACNYPPEAIRIEPGYPLNDANVGRLWGFVANPCRAKPNMFSIIPAAPRIDNSANARRSTMGLFARYFKRCCDYSQGPVGTYYRCELPSQLRYDTEYSTAALWFGPGPTYNIDTTMYDYNYGFNLPTLNDTPVEVGTYQFSRTFPDTIQVIDTTGTPP